MTDSVFILSEQLRKAKQEIATLRRVVDYTIAIVVGAGGRVEVPSAALTEWSNHAWTHENDGTTHIFTAIAPQPVEAAKPAPDLFTAGPRK